MRFGLVAMLLVGGCHHIVVHQYPDGGGETPEPVANPDLGPAPSPPDLAHGPADLGPEPAVPGGSITTPPVCTAGAEVKLTDSLGVSGFEWLWDTDHFVLVYAAGPKGQGDIYVQRFGPDGSSLALPQLVEATTPDSISPTLARTATGYVVAWEEAGTPRTVRARALDASANPIGLAQLLASSTAKEARPVVSPSPAGVALAWTNVLGTVETVIVGHLDSQLRLDDVRTLGDGVHDTAFPWLAGDDLSLAVLWSDHRLGKFDMHFQRFDDQAAAVNATEVVIRDAVADAQLGRMIKTTFGFMSAWEDSRTGDNEIRMALTDSQGGMIAEGLVEEPGTGDANWPHLAWNGVSAGIAYYQFRNGSPQIYLSLVDAAGKRVDGGADVQVSRAPSGKWARYPNVQWTGSAFGVTWVDTRDPAAQVWFSPVTCMK